MTEAKHSAFPEFHARSVKSQEVFGLTKREYFSAMILQGFCSFRITKEMRGEAPGANFLQRRAEAAVKQADALIAALNAEVLTKNEETV